MKKALKITGRILAYLFMSILIGGNLYIINAKFVMHEQLPMLGGYGYAVVLSGSMSPALDVNDLLIVKECDSYEPGDMVTFVDSQNDLVTHRLVSIDTEKNIMVTKGDANNINDPPLESSRIKGKVVKIIPGFGNVVNILQNPLFVLLVLAVFIFITERSYKKEKKRRKSDLELIQKEIEQLKLKSCPVSSDNENTAETAGDSSQSSEPSSDETAGNTPYI